MTDKFIAICQGLYWVIFYSYRLVKQHRSVGPGMRKTRNKLCIFSIGLANIDVAIQHWPSFWKTDSSPVLNRKLENFQTSFIIIKKSITIFNFFSENHLAQEQLFLKSFSFQFFRVPKMLQNKAQKDLKIWIKD